MRVFFYPSFSELGRGSGTFSHSDDLHGKLSSKPQEVNDIVINNNRILI